MCPCECHPHDPKRPHLMLGCCACCPALSQPGARYDFRRLVGATIRLAQGPCKGDEVVVMRTDVEHPGEIEVMWRQEPTEWLPGMVVAGGTWSNAGTDSRMPGAFWIPVSWASEATVLSEEVIQLQLREMERKARARRTGLPWDHPDSDPAGDVRAAMRDAQLHAPCQARIRGLEIDLAGRDNIVTNQRATIESLQRELREARAGVGRKGWGQRG